MCAKCSSRAISSSVMFTMPRSFLNSAGTCLFAFGSSIDSVRYVTTMRFCSRVMLRSSAAYGAIGVSLILCANVVIIVICLGFGCKDSENRVKYTILIVNLIKIFRIAFGKRWQPCGTYRREWWVNTSIKIGDTSNTSNTQIICTLCTLHTPSWIRCLSFG